MDLQKLVYLESIHRLGSFTKASEELHVSQPAITKSIKSLENEVGVELIIRKPKVLIFTDAGQALVRWAKRIIEDFRAASQEMEQYSDSVNMTLNIGISNMVGSWLYTDMYSSFMRAYPQSTILIKDYPWADLCDMVINHELDMAYTTWEPDFSDSRLDLFHFLDSELYIVLPPKHDLGKLKRIPFQMLENYTLSVFAKNSLINKIVSEKCEQNQMHTSLINLTNHFSTMLNMVDTGEALGFVVIDKKSAAFNKHKYVLRPFEDPILLRTGLITRHNQVPTKIMRLFSRYIQQNLD